MKQELEIWRRGLMEFSNLALVTILKERLECSNDGTQQVLNEKPVYNKATTVLRADDPHSVICSSCGVKTTVPFNPRSDKPVFCRDCYDKRRAGWNK